MTLEDLKHLIDQNIIAWVERSTARPEIARLAATEAIVRDLARCVTSENPALSLDLYTNLWREEIEQEQAA